MQIIKYAGREKWPELLRRPSQENDAVLRTVQSIMENVRTHKDKALRELTEKFDGFAPDYFKLDSKEFAAAAKALSPGLIRAIQQAKENIESFHKEQVGNVTKIETVQGVVCWRKNVAIESVGLYIPGGTAPLFSTVLMLGIPARIAGCKNIILCTPCNREGKVHPAIIYTAGLIGITNIYKLGGAQAIAAMAYGTESIPRVSKIFGPGNQFVTAAKQLVQMYGTAIDMPAGPSEVCVLADDKANPAFVAADLLSQAEHGKDSQVLLVSNSEELIEKCIKEMERQCAIILRQDIILHSLKNSKAFLVQDISEAIDLVNEYAPEHLIINCYEAANIAERIINAGSVFIGQFSPESAGDYASGTNHTLPTNGFAKAFSGVSVDSFVKKITFQQLSERGLNSIADTIINMAEAEGLHAHAKAVRIRMGQ